MKIVAVHSRFTGSTHAIALMLLDEIGRLEPGAQIDEFCVAGFKPCVGCFSCFANGEDTCPHYAEVHPIATAIEQADVVVLDSPTYVMGISGAMKSFLDHLAYRWFAHRPHPSMGKKIGVAISTTGGSGVRGVTKALKAQFFGLSMAKYYRLGFSIMAFNWGDVNPKKKARIERAVRRTARRVVALSGKAKRGLFLRLLLWGIHFMQQKNDWFPLDHQWWKDNGWIK
ncbi:MAG: NAD(P)H-dependent oxidoreductase [Clostridiales Family XIII bacterium]|jgi:multimeric flavodoxin WrbA|nr:NAD(P)H-dependent oxidoreductase [Clostridiales Family XIII bacterium]